MTTVLQFSGGKDSLAVLHLMQPRWNDLTVMWINTGAAFPEVEAMMAEIKKLVPHFLEVRSTQNIAEEGYPSDEIIRRVGFQSRYSCCWHAIWGPAHRAVLELGAKTLIRGQKKCDSPRAQVDHGDIVDGITYIHPLEDWSDEDVFAYLKSHGIPIPRNYEFMKSGLDCWNCTGYRQEHAGVRPYLAKYHPEKALLVESIIQRHDDQLQALV